MNIINRICEMHSNDYNVMSETWLDSVHLTYSAHISSELRRRLEHALDRLDVEVDPCDGVVKLELDTDGDGGFLLNRSDELMYRFANKAPGFYFPDYDVVEAIAWTVYAIVSHNEKTWFHNASGNLARGAYISCESFVAKQQAVASRIMKSVNAQSVSEIPANQMTLVLKQMLEYADQFTHSIPLFSGRPISEAAYKEYRGKTVEKKLEEIAEDLFANGSFETEISSYREFIRQNDAYHEQVAKARKDLTRNIYELPIMVVSRFFTELNEAIISMHNASWAQLEELLAKPVRFSLTAEKLKTAFADVDSFCAEYARNAIRQDFLREVLETTKQELDSEQLEARKICKQMRRELSRFCYVQEDTFQENENAPLMGWKQLMTLQERELSLAADIRWSADTMIQLQRKMMNPEEPNCWLCARPLQEASVKLQGTDQFDTQAVPLMDQRCVIALWAREYME